MLFMVGKHELWPFLNLELLLNGTIVGHPLI